MEQASLVEQLFTQTVQIFASDPHVYEMFLFGSFEKKTHDRYSDIDLHIVSQNFDATMGQLSRSLSEIGQVLVLFPLTAHIDHAAYMVLFANYPLYTKLDINITSTKQDVSFAEKTCVYRRGMLPSNVASTYIPTLFDEPLNTLYGSYLGAIRYMKYRKREKHFSAYKFYRAQLDQTLLRAYKDSNPEFSLERLGILEYQVLDSYEESTKLKRYLYPKNEKTMDMLYIDLLQTMTTQSSASQDHKKVFKTILDFLKQEAL